VPWRADQVANAIHVPSSPRDPRIKGAVKKRTENQVDALMSLYATEREDLSNVSNQCTAIIGLVLTYVIAVFISLGHVISLNKTPLAWFASPVPVLVFLCFYTMHVSLAIARTKSCRELEGEISSIVKIRSDKIGVAISDRIMDIGVAPWPQKGLILAAYAPIILAVISLIVYIVAKAVLYHAHIWIIILSVMTYVALLVPASIAWAKQMHL
jgi:hypothetical protein